MRLSAKEAKKISDAIDFGKMEGLVPVVAQDEATRDVLTLAFMDSEALQKTLASGRMHYHSRSRKRLWRKGETSGNEQALLRFFVDCDADSLLFFVRQRGVACHTGAWSCFFEEKNGNALQELFAVIEERKQEPRKGSYTNALLADKNKLLKKIGEESAELVAAAASGSKRDVVCEASDLLYHMLALLASRGATLDDVYAELKRRRK